MERISIIQGDTPVLIAAPHGPDDRNTDLLAELVAEEFGAFAVINRGFRRGPQMDYARDIVNCNDVRHIHNDVVKEEFMEPLFRSVARIKKKYDENVFFINLHGCSDNVRNVAGDPDLEMIIGSGSKPSWSCRLRIKNAFVYYLESEGFVVYEGKTKYAAKSKNNLTQLFTQWYPTPGVNALQLEVVSALRTEDELHGTASGIVSAIDSLMLFDDTTEVGPIRAKKI